MHGGARGSGAPKGEANGAYKVGAFTGEAIAFRQQLAAVLRECREQLKQAA
jgi:hypothetical protein